MIQHLVPVRLIGMVLVVTICALGGLLSVRDGVEGPNTSAFNMGRAVRALGTRTFDFDPFFQTFTDRPRSRHGSHHRYFP